MDLAQQPLKGVKVLELSQIMAGPICGLMLADLGAEVIKVEKFPKGDDARAYNNSGAQGEVSRSFQTINRGKKSIALDIRTERGKALLLEMVRDADVVTENFRPGTMQRLGLGPDDMLAVNPALIYVSINGFGSQGPLADRGGFDLVLQAFSGLIHVTGEADRRPVKPGVPLADVNAGILACLGTLSAYIHRLRSGTGQWVQTSLLQASTQYLYWYAAMHFGGGAVPTRLGTAHPVIAPYQTYTCADGELALGGGNDSIWQRIASIVGHPEWSQDPRFASAKDRLENRQALAALMDGALKQKSRADWEQLFTAAGVPASSVQSVGEALDHPQTHAIGMVIDAEAAEGGMLKTIGFPIHFNGKNSPAISRAPKVGEHTREILGERGLDVEAIDALMAERVCFESEAVQAEEASQ
ncbi:CaiB/BaiF CoA transferase family protein [Paraburkholderia silviterrae]|uniref:CoA transferase n=1 Tax=Paraburkholderia silviterrae TaxID=2528715 RepID=A0A4R5M995_9BURK|nr:CoA transferase [Paraburkholderia silviterrae]TDG22784.1 CoA transferase [Paraburkholderia silviterrae]